MQDTPALFSVLVADAEPTLCRVFEAKLTKEGRFRVACASTAQEAYRLALHSPFDILLWDLRLRDSDTVLPRLRALSPDAALLLMSTDDQPTISMTVLRLDITGVLIKPFGLDTLEASIRSALTQRTRQQPLHQIGFVGQYVTIRTPSGACLTRVFENAHDTFLVVGATRVATPPDFGVGLKVQVEYNGRGALYSFDSTLVRELTEPLPCWELAMPDLIRRLQRRRAPRIPLQKMIRLHAAGEGPDLLCDGTTTDISILGLALLSATALEIGTHVYFTISPDVTGRASVVRTQSQRALTGDLHYRIALQFDDVPSQTQAHLEGWLENAARLW